MLDLSARSDNRTLIDDTAFRLVMRVSAAVFLVSLWSVSRLPDLRLHEGGPAAT